MTASHLNYRILDALSRSKDGLSGSVLTARIGDGAGPSLSRMAKKGWVVRLGIDAMARGSVLWGITEDGLAAKGKM